MNKLDKQFGEMMKGGIRLDSPSSDFTLKVMSRVYAEAAVKPKSVLQDYQPVISKRTWIIMISAFVFVMIYLISMGNGATEGDKGLVSDFAGKLNSLNDVFKNGIGLFKAIPSVAYLIVISALGLWTLDSVFQRFHQHSIENKY
jgi:hypothetical protein